MLKALPAVVSALPDLMLGATFLITWVSPYALREKMVAYLMLLMILEFIIVHSSAFMGRVMVGPLQRGRKSVTLLGLGGLYTLFVGGFALAFKAWWPLVTFWGLTLNRLLGVLLGQPPSGEEKTFVQYGWAASVMFYVLFVFATTLLPIPALGITAEVVRAQDLPGSGLWIDQPQRVVAFGFLYFTATGLSELFGQRWLAKGRVGGSGAS